LATPWARLGLHIASGHPSHGGNKGDVDQRTRPIPINRLHVRIPREGCH
jgi:hypothetical protein